VEGIMKIKINIPDDEYCDCASGTCQMLSWAEYSGTFEKLSPFKKYPVCSAFGNIDLAMVVKGNGYNVKKAAICLENGEADGKC
jgi:hypothetical protein